jgi:kynurenine formamidase
MIVDLTHTIRPEMPVYPGDPQPELKPNATLTRNHFRQTLLRLTSHTGTHMDAPAHILQNGPTLDALPVSQFAGRAVVVNASHLPAGSVITEECLRSLNGHLLNADFVLFYTGWERKWGTDEYFTGFPVPDSEAARYLVTCGLKGVGTDAVSLDPVGSEALDAHRVLLGGGLVVLENLCLRRVVDRGSFRFYALPLKFAGADGAPVRAIAELRDLSEKETEEA